MGYLGRVKPLESIGNVVRSTYTGDASTTTYNLPVAVANEESIIVTINGVTQQDAAYSTNGTQLIFASAPALNDSIEIRCISGVGQGYTPPDGSVTTAKLNSQAVTADKLHNTLDLSGKTVTYGLSGSDLPTGSILQVVQTQKTDTFSTTSTTYVDITGLSASITPSSSSSKILVSVTIGNISNQDAGYAILLRDSTQILDAATGGTSVFAGGYGGGGSDGESYFGVVPKTNTLLDSPNTTSSVTYKIQARTYNAAHTTYINRSVYDAGQYNVRNVSTITLMEIAG